MQTKKLHLSTINKIANKFELELVKGEGYFYWWGTTAAMQTFTASCYTTSVGVFKLNDLPFNRWLQELDEIKKTIKEEIIESIQNIEKYAVENKYYRDNYTFEHLYDYWKDLIK